MQTTSYFEALSNTRLQTSSLETSISDHNSVQYQTYAGVKEQESEKSA